MPILFYDVYKCYGCFSNFAPFGFWLDDTYWQTSEHYFQAQKFAGTAYADQVRLAPTPKEAAKLGRRRDWPLRSDWETVKDEVMLRAVLRKFEVHPNLRRILLATGDEELIEDTRKTDDRYWGCGADGKGLNKLGKILMEVRRILREREQGAV